MDRKDINAYKDMIGHLLDVYRRNMAAAEFYGRPDWIRRNKKWLDAVHAEAKRLGLNYIG
jgi:hypothetical protein